MVVAVITFGLVHAVFNVVRVRITAFSRSTGV